MQPKQAMLGVSAGLIAALVFIAFMSGQAYGIFFLVYMVPLPMLAVGLGMGVNASVLAVATGTVLVLIAGSPWAGLMFLALNGLPALVVVWFATRITDAGLARAGKDVAEPLPGREADVPGLPQRPRSYDAGAAANEVFPDRGWYPAGGILVWLAVLAGCYVAAAALFSGDGLHMAVTEYLTGMFEVIAPKQDAAVKADAIAMLGEIFPGAIGAFWILMLGVNATFAQGLLAKGSNNLRPSPRMGELTLPDWPSWALVAFAALGLMAPGELGYVCRNIVVVLMVPYFFLGLSVVHVMAGMLRFPGMMLAAVYIATLATGWFTLVIAGIGITEQWVGLRRRLEKTD